MRRWTEAKQGHKQQQQQQHKKRRDRVNTPVNMQTAVSATHSHPHYTHCLGVNTTNMLLARSQNRLHSPHIPHTSTHLPCQAFGHHRPSVPHQLLLQPCVCTAPSGQSAVQAGSVSQSVTREVGGAGTGTGGCPGAAPARGEWTHCDRRVIEVVRGDS